MIAFKIACSNSLGLPKILRENGDFVFVMKAKVTQKRVNLHKSFFMNYVRESVGNSLQYLILLKIRTTIDSNQTLMTKCLAVFCMDK